MNLNKFKPQKPAPLYGTEFRARCERMGLTQSQVGEVMGIDRSTVNRYMCDQCNIPTVVILSLNYLENCYNSWFIWSGADHTAPYREMISEPQEEEEK